jgi:hypothetical protein
MKCKGAGILRWSVTSLVPSFFAADTPMKCSHGTARIWLARAQQVRHGFHSLPAIVMLCQTSLQHDSACAGRIVLLAVCTACESPVPTSLQHLTRPTICCCCYSCCVQWCCGIVQQGLFDLNKHLWQSSRHSTSTGGLHSRRCEETCVLAHKGSSKWGALEEYFPLSRGLLLHLTVVGGTIHK